MAEEAYETKRFYAGAEPHIGWAAVRRIEALRTEYFHRRKVLMDYLEMKWKEYDLHGVEDAASDLRDIEAALEALRRVEE